MIGKYLAIANMCLSAAACVGYLIGGDIRLAIYWFGAVVLTGAVTL